jgi:hypothetical protein
MENKKTLYGITTFANQCVKAEKIDFNSNTNEYNYLCLDNRTRDDYGNGNFEFQFFKNKENEIILPNNWQFEIRGGWDWNSYGVYITLKDQYENTAKVKLSYRINCNSDKFVESSIVDTLNRVLIITQKNMSAIEFELAENHSCLDYIRHTMPMSKSRYEQLTKSLKSYWKTYTQYIKEPIYQQDQTEENKKKISTNICELVDLYLNAEILDNQ